jgi:hypothetical protein
MSRLISTPKSSLSLTADADCDMIAGFSYAIFALVRAASCDVTSVQDGESGFDQNVAVADWHVRLEIDILTDQPGITCLKASLLRK